MGTPGRDLGCPCLAVCNCYPEARIPRGILFLDRRHGRERVGPTWVPQVVTWGTHARPEISKRFVCPFLAVCNFYPQKWVTLRIDFTHWCCPCKPWPRGLPLQLDPTLGCWKGTRFVAGGLPGCWLLTVYLFVFVCICRVSVGDSGYECLWEIAGHDLGYPCQA